MILEAGRLAVGMGLLDYDMDAVGRMAGPDLEIRATDTIVGMSNGNLTTLLGRHRDLEAEEKDKTNQ
jgi:hypothetical protein